MRIKIIIFMALLFPSGLFSNITNITVSTGIQDGYILEFDKVYDSKVRLRTGDEITDNYVSFIGFNLQTLPDFLDITSATLFLNAYSKRKIILLKFQANFTHYYELH